jgi:hypothetical protein
MATNGVEAEQALAEALTSVGLTVNRPGHDSNVDILVDVPAGNRLAIEAKYTSLASMDGLARKLDRWERQVPEKFEGLGLVHVLVADRVTADAKDLLRDTGWGWLDLRGHLHVVAPGLFVDANVEPFRGPAHRHHDPFAGKSGLEVTVELLLDPHPNKPIGIRSLAKRIHRSPSTVSEVLSRLREAHLVEDDLSPVVPDLFWSIASAWRPVSAHVASLPDDGDQPLLNTLRVGLESGSRVGWALTDSQAAHEYGAPIALRRDYPPTLYVPDDVTLRRATQVLGTSNTSSDRSGTLAVAPVSAVCEQRIADQSTSMWPLAHPLFVALDLAQDPGRGREILSEWTPPEWWPRVW